jgi:hypothetical protein
MAFEAPQVMQLLVWMAGIVIALLTAIMVFFVGWQLRQDTKIAELDRKTAGDSEKLVALHDLVKHNIPELFEKWDKLILERKDGKS